MPGQPLTTEYQPGGMFAVYDRAHTTGTVFFVHSGTGVNGAGYGRDPGKPVATLAYAVSLCTAGKDDRIMLMPGHAEAISSATAAVLNIAGITVIGMGRGANRATLTIDTANTALISVTAANVRLLGVRIVANFLDIASLVSVAAAADGFEMEDCEVVDTSSVLNAVIGVLIAAACDRVRIEKNRFFFAAGSAAASAVKLAGASDKSIVRNNYIMGDFSVAAIDGRTAAGTLLMLDANVIQNIDTTTGLCIDLHASTTGAVVRNLLQGAKTNTVPLVAAGCMVHENYTSAAVNESGIIRPAVETYA